MKILAVGDVVGASGCEFLMRHLRRARQAYGVDLCIVNGENSARGNGVTADSCETLFDAGADVLTMGNHTYQKREVYDYLDGATRIVRPYNFHPEAPGQGWIVVQCDGVQVLVGSLQGRVYLDTYENPFTAVDRMLSKVDPAVKVRIIDFHAEATSEKIAMGHYLDGRATLLFGTHTHVQTADECIFPKGLGYITDLGMTGPMWSVIGVDPHNVVKKFVTNMPQRFQECKNPVQMSGILAEVDVKLGITTKIERVNLK